MNWINLYEYIKYWMFLKNLDGNNPYDIVIYENFENSEIEIPKSINMTTMKELWFEFGYSWALSALSKKYKNILIILDWLSYIYLIPFIKSIWKKNFTILNLWSWISWYINKWNPDLDDIWVLSDLNIGVYENYDMSTFYHSLSNKWTKYIRIMNKEIAVNLFQTSENEDEIVWWFIQWWDAISMTEFWLSGNSWTILVWASLALDMILAHQSLWKDKWYDVFLITNYSFDFDDKILNSLNKTKKLIVLLDASSNYENYIKAKLFDLGIKNFKIIFIYPKTEKITTFLKDYIYKQAEFDSEWLFNHLS